MQRHWPLVTRHLTPAEPHGPLLLTPTGAAIALGIGCSEVYEPMQTGQLPSVHIGACRRDPAQALHAFFDRLRTAG